MQGADSRSHHRFADEWLVRLVSALPDPPARQIADWRAEGREYLSQALLDAEILSFDMIASLIRNAYRIESVELDQKRPERAVLSLLPEKVARRHRVVPIHSDGRSIAVAMANPLDPEATQDVESVTGRQMVPLFCPPSFLHELELEHQDPDALIYDLARKFGATEKVEVLERESADAAPEEDPEAPGTVRAPVVNLVDGLIAQAVRMGASDIHIDHEETSSVVRYRIDGVLRNMVVLPRYLASGPVVARIKIMAGLDISVRMRPQDGRAKLRMGGETVGIRVSTLPSQEGEKVVMRILDEKSIQIPLEKLGFHPRSLERLRWLLGQKQGVILVTGPTGSGKTTTLYAALREMTSEKVNVITVEDPVEYKLKGITQVQVHERQGLGFPIVLRSALRQDPDVILVGEIRDEETASVAIQAAQTGHLVLSTLHTNDAASTVVRLADMGVEGFKLEASLLAVTAQRLVRRLCDACAKDALPDTLPATTRKAMKRLHLTPHPREPVGCPECRFTGYRGRLPFVELLEVTDAVRAAIGDDVGADDLTEVALRDWALRTLEEDALWHVSEGRTTLEECAGVIREGRLEKLGTFAPPTHATPGPSPFTRPGHRPRIVVASGDVSVGQNLSEADFEVEAVGDGAAALGAVARSAPDALVVGDDLSTMSADQVVRTVRTVMGFVDLPIVVVGFDAACVADATDTVEPNGDSTALVRRIEAALERRFEWSEPDDVASPRIPFDEVERLIVLRGTGMLDTAPEERFDTITREAAEALRAPVATISLVDGDRLWFKSRYGLAKEEVPREISFCAHAINHREGFVIRDARMDVRFATSPVVDGGIRAYAGQPIRSPDGHVIGMMCVMDRVPREFDAKEVEELAALRNRVEHEVWPTAN